MKTNHIFITVVAVFFLAITLVFLTFPRSTFSEMERRELASFPEYSHEKLASGNFTKEVSQWFSDSEPYRDIFMTLSMQLKGLIALQRSDEDAITIHADNTPTAQASAPVDPDLSGDGNMDEFNVTEGRDAKAKIASNGIIVVGNAPNARALMIYGGIGGGDGYAAAANKYKETFGSKVNVYCMVIPSSTEYYLPEKVKGKSKAMLTTIKNIHSKLRSDVKPVDVYTILGHHSSEPIFLRTDHHWAPLGAFYTAKKFADVAGVPFKDLGSYEKKVIHGFVGTMYGYSKDIAVKNSPEDFVFYKPKDVAYKTTYINYTIDENYNVTAESKPTSGELFYTYKDGSSLAYNTFMGGDAKITQVRTGTGNGRRLIIIKDSFGNALPGYLCYSFEEIHVIDSRYFTKNMKKYVADNKITDILFANNVFKAYSVKASHYTDFLKQ